MRKWITIRLMKQQLDKAIIHKAKQENEIVRQAYDNLIKSYKSTIMFLEASKA